MACLSETKIYEYIAGDLAHIEAKYVKDHLAGCEPCRNIAVQYRRLEKALQKPLFIEPPDTIIKNVMRQLYPPYPRYSSIAAMILASVLFLISWIYIYFNFANNSLIKAMHLTSKSASNWLFKILSGIETVFTMIQTTFKALSHFIHSLLHINVNPNAIGAIFLTLSAISFYFLFGYFARAIRERQK